MVHKETICGPHWSNTMTGPEDGDIEDDYDDEDYEKVCCYCQQPSHGTII